METKNEISYNGKSIHYTNNGSGPALILLHGFTESLNIWEDFTKELSSDFQVVCIDLPGHGKSPVFSEVHSMEFMAETVKAVLDKLSLSECVMIGHSMGGYVTLAFADKYPQMIKAFGLFHSQAAADSEEAKNNRQRTVKIVESNRSGFIQNFIPDLFNPANISEYKNEIEQLKQMALLPPSEGIAAALKGMMERKDYTLLLSTTKKPVLFIAGKADSRISLDIVFQQARQVTFAEVLILGNAGHMGFIEARKETLEGIWCFAKKAFELR